MASRDLSPAVSGVVRGEAEFECRDSQIIARRMAGEGPRSIARSMSLSPGAVASVLRRRGMCDPASPHAISMAKPGSGRRHTPDPDQSRAIRRLAARGYPYREIARLLGVTFYRIWVTLSAPDTSHAHVKGPGRTT